MDTPVIDPTVIDSLATSLGRTREQMEAIVANLRDGLTLSRAFAGSGLNHGQRQIVIRALGWSLSWRRRGLRRSATVGSLSKEEALRLLDERVPQAEIARRAGVSRQRIQQIEKEAGRRRRATFTRVLRAMSLDDAAKFMAAAKSMHDRGDSLERIAEIYNVTPQVMSAYFAYCRKHLGPTWFAVRNAPRRPEAVLAVPTEQLEQFMARAQELWLERVPLAEIAAKYGMTLRQMKLHMKACRERLNLGWFKHRLAPWVIQVN